MAHKLIGVNLLVNYPDDSVEAAMPEHCTLEEAIQALRKLFDTEPDMTSFILTAVKAEAGGHVLLNEGTTFLSDAYSDCLLTKEELAELRRLDQEQHDEE